MWLKKLLKKKSTFLYLQWVTLIEVIFAIIIFWTWILVILSTITSNIRWLYDIKEKDIALSIAKEWIDIVYHVRDSNLERGLFWDCAVIDLSEDDACGWFFYEWSSTTRHIINFDKDWLYSMDPFTTSWAAQIWYHEDVLFTFSGSDISWFWYDHNMAGWEETIYTRVIEFDPVVWHEAFTWFVLEVTSRVSYPRGNSTEEVVLQSIIWDIR